VKRSVGGGAHRGPVGVTRQRRTIRFVQLLLVLIAAGLLVFAGYSWGTSDGFERGRRRDVDAPSRPSAMQTAALVLLGAAALGGAVALQGPGGVRIPTPARLDELAGRAESARVERS
jgi:hypothetical protein